MVERTHTMAVAVALPLLAAPRPRRVEAARQEHAATDGDVPVHARRLHHLYDLQGAVPRRFL